MPGSGAVADAERCYRAVSSRDARFDGVFFTGVRTTGIYCRPSCPAMTPRRANVRFFATAAAAHAAGFRACRRCLPDATPGSPEWDLRTDAVGRAMRLIRDGVVERDGVAGLAARLGYSQRHVQRLLQSELGAGPLALARAQRAHTARVLVETTHLPVADVAFAAGFASIRQFNDTMREVYAQSPQQLRAARGSRPDPTTSAGRGRVQLRLPVRAPFAADQVLAFLAARAVPGLECGTASTFTRVVRLGHGLGVIWLAPGPGHVDCVLELADLRDLGAAVQRCRALLDLDADPLAVLDVLGADPVLGALVAAAPGVRVPGHVDGFELAVRAVLGQQVTVPRARQLATDLVRRLGQPLATGTTTAGPSTAFPTAEALAGEDPARLGMPRRRGRALVHLATAVAQGRLDLGPGADRGEATAALLGIPGIGPWTAGYIAMRALRDPDVFLGGDTAVRAAMARLGLPASEPAAARYAFGWRPWRSYAVMHLWRCSAATPTPADTNQRGRG